MAKLQTLFAAAFIAIVSMGSPVFSEGKLIERLAWIVQGGMKHESIVGRNQLDGVSGATKTLWSVSAGAEFAIKGHPLETGLAVGTTDQHIDYHPTAPDRAGTGGERDISLLLLDVPLLYNFHFCPAKPFDRKSGRLLVGVGALASFVLSQRIVSVGAATSEKLSDWALGPLFRLSYFPVELKGVRPGLYFDFYRSFLPKYFYDHPYFKQNRDAGQLGAIDLGISLRI